MRCINKMARKSLVGMFLLLISAFIGHAAAQTCVQPPAGLVSWWPGDGDANDIISSNNGAFESGVTFVPGMVDQAFSFDGTEGVKVQDAPTLNPVDAITVSAWINRASTTYASPIVKKAGEGTNQHNGFALEFYGGSDLVHFGVYITDVGWRIIRSDGYPAPNNVWTHVVGTYDGTNLNVYVDGALCNSVSYPPAPIAPSGNSLYIGRDPANLERVYHGLIDEPSIYNRALSPAEIQAIFNAGSAGKCKVTFDLPSGWSMVSLPINPTDKTLKAVFPNAVVVYGYEKGVGYVRVKAEETLTVGKGYWILLDQATSYTITGQPIESYTLATDEGGWDMIGGCTDPAQVIPHGCDSRVIHGFTQEIGYQRVTGNLERGKGYWILLNNVTDGATITVETVD